MSEIDLIKRAVTGDKNAFAALYMQYRDRLYRYAYFKLGNSADAEDAVSACIAEAYQSIHTLKKPAAFPAWIFRILYRSCSALIKEQSEVRERGSMTELEKLPHTDSALAPELSEALSQLSAEDRDIVLLSVVAGYNSREIASVMKLKSSTVRSRLARGLKKMREFLE